MKAFKEYFRQLPAIKEKLSPDASFNYRSSRSDLPHVEPSQPDERPASQVKVSFEALKLLNAYTAQIGESPDRARQNVEDTAFGWETAFKDLVVAHLIKMRTASSDVGTGSAQADSLSRDYITQVLAIIDPPEDEFGQAGSEPVGPDDLVGAPA